MRLVHIPFLAAAIAFASAGRSPVLHAQAPATLPPDSISLADLSAFRDPPRNWRIVGGASANRERENRIDTEPGTGTLVNVASPGDGGELRTAWEHGDIDLELEFLMPRGSNSGIYFQGRYELQLLDSWGVENPTFGDVGGIYQRWDEARGEGREGYEGYAPRLNAARAPGLWQTLRVEFRAPRFDPDGRKVANARFVRVELNGAVIHENVELSGPTRGPFLSDEAVSGPIVIQGDHGPVAFRNVRFKRYGTRPLSIQGLRYRVHEGIFNSLPDLSGRTPDRDGDARGLTASVAGVADRFALIQEGSIDLPEAGRYLFELRLGWIDGEGGDGNQGGARLTVAGQEVLHHSGRERTVTAEADLPAGRHPLVLELFKNREGRPAGFDLFAEGPGVARQALTEESRQARGTATGAIAVEPHDEPYLLRSFLEHAGEKRTHVISVGEPAGIHYSYDAELGAILLAWRGPFLETTQMWEGRGEPQLAEPLGSVLALAAAPAVAALAGADAVWPDSVPAGSGFRFLGYDLNEERRPVFRYRFGDLTIEDRIRPAGERRGLLRTIRAAAPQGRGGMYVRLAAGEEIARMRDGSYRVDGGFYVLPTGDARRAVLRSVEGGQELVVPLTFRGGNASVEYEIIW